MSSLDQSSRGDGDRTPEPRGEDWVLIGWNTRATDPGAETHEVMVWLGG